MERGIESPGCSESLQPSPLLWFSRNGRRGSHLPASPHPDSGRCLSQASGKGRGCSELESCWRVTSRVREDGPGEPKMKRKEPRTRRERRLTGRRSEGLEGTELRVPIPRVIRSSHHSGHQRPRRCGDLRDRCPQHPEPGDASTASHGAGASAVASIPASDRWPALPHTPHRASEAR